MTTRPTMSRLSWTNVRDYLTFRGFRLLPTGWTDVGVYRHGEVEVRLPFDPTFDDYQEALERAAGAIARFEQRTVDEVITDLAMPRTDKVRFAQTGEGTADGLIAVEFAPALVEGARKALLSSAHSEERPEIRYHKRMSRSIPEAFLRACRLGPAEQRSFAFSIHCPHEIPDDLPMSHFGRRSVVRLMQSVGQTVDTFVRFGSQAIVDAPVPITTANLCEALVQMMPRDEHTDLALDVRFSPILPAPDAIPTTVRIERALYRVFEDLSRMLRPPQSPIEDVHVGRVVELRADSNDAGKLEGEVVLRLDADEELIRARCSLGPEDYRKALDAHARQRYVSIRGKLMRGGRMYLLENPNELTVIE